MREIRPGGMEVCSLRGARNRGDKTYSLGGPKIAWQESLEIGPGQDQKLYPTVACGHSGGAVCCGVAPRKCH